MAATVTGYPSETEFTLTTSDTTESSELVSYIEVCADDFTGDDYIEVVYNSETVTIYLQEECRYTPKEIHFINKEGAEQILTFYKATEDKISIKKETYESDRGQPSAGNHQYIDYNVNARSSFKVTSGFVEEDMNDVFKQLLLSSRLWLASDDGYTPLNVKTSSLTYKNRQKDRLISYDVEFEYSYSDINNI